MPGVSKYKDALNNVDDREFEKMSVLIHSMTAEERKKSKASR